MASDRLPDPPYSTEYVVRVLTDAANGPGQTARRLRRSMVIVAASVLTIESQSSLVEVLRTQLGEDFFSHEVHMAFRAAQADPAK